MIGMYIPAGIISYRIVLYCIVSYCIESYDTIRHPHTTHQRHNMGVSSWRTGDNKSQLRGCHIMIPKNFSDDRVQKNLAIANKHLRENLDDHEAHITKAVCLAQQGMLDEAMVHLDKVEKAARHQKNSKLLEVLYMAKGATALKMKRSKDAILCFKKALKLNPDSGFAYFFVGNTLFGMKKFRESIPYFDRAIRHGCDDPDAYFRKAQAQNGCGMYPDALKCLKKAVRAYPDNANIHREMGITHMNMGKFKHSIICQKRAIRADPQHWGAYVCLGVSYAKAGQHRLARQCVNRTQKLFPKDHNVLELLEMLKNECGYS